MEVQLEHSTEEIKRLQRCINDLVSVLALPAIWTGGEPSQIVSTLLEALLGMLRLDLVYVRLKDPVGGAPIEMVRFAQSRNPPVLPQELGEALKHWLGDDPLTWLSLVRKPVGDQDISLVPLRLGLQGEIGVIVAGSQRADFPGKTEKLVLSVAANQAAIGLQGARLLSEQRRVTSELDERWRSVFENSAVGVAVTDLDGRFITANPVYQKMLGYTEEELKKLSFLDITHEDYLEPSRAFIGELLEGKRQQFQIEKQHRRKNGSLVWVRNNVSIVPDTERVPGFLIALSEDITERKQAEEALRVSERNLRLIINTIPTLAWSARPDGFADFFNQRWLDFTGFSAEGAQGWGWGTAIHPDDRKKLVDYWQSHLATGAPLETEARMRHFDGAFRWFLFRAAALRDELGNIVKWYGTNTDIDDRKRAEERLKRSEAFLVEGQQLGRLGSFSWRVTTNEIMWSEQLYRIFEFDQGQPVTLELIGTRVHPDDLPLLAEMIDRASRGVSDFEYEHRLLMPDRSVKYLHMSAHGIRDQEDRLEYIGAVQDVTERRLSEEALNKVQSELAHVARVTSLGALTASIAHEVNQPLSGIITNAGTCLRMLKADPPNVEGARETARRTIRDCNRASDVITRLRALFSKKDAMTEWVDLNEAVREVITLSLSGLQRNRVILRSELAHDLPLVTGDRVQLQQVILNLLQNASDAMSAVDDRPRQLLIRTEPEEGDHVRLTVQDSGVGFDPQVAERLFDAFYTTKFDGMGIGLSVSRSIIESHHGRLSAKPNDGPGATFSFAIPRGPVGLTDAASLGATQTPDAINPWQVLRNL